MSADLGMSPPVRTLIDMERVVIKQRSGLGSGFAVGCLVALLVVCGVGAAGLYAVFSLLGGNSGDSEVSGLAPVVQLGLVVALLVAAHGVTIAWAVRTHPGRRTLALTQGPYVAAYAMIPVWWQVGQWSAWFIAWGAAGAVALGWLLVWYLSAASVGRRAVIFLSGLAVLVLVNGVGILAVAWHQTNGFGLAGQPSPWTAVNTLASTSCLSDNRFHQNGSRTVESQCPNGPNGNYYAGEYDTSAFDNVLCADQPRSAFTKWWQWNKQYRVEFRLRFDTDSAIVDGREIGAPYPEKVDGKKATVVTTMTIESVSHIGVENPYRMQAETTTEQWTVQLESVALGGWKVCNIAIADPISATFIPEN